jgi:branched-subunit amino acid transport protein
MSSGFYWTALILVAGGTLFFRLVFLGARRAPALPGPLKKAMDFVPTAVLAALVIPQFIRLPDPDWPVLGAGLAAASAALFFKLDFLAIVAGFLAYWLITLLSA